ncbi:MAG: hypothetical protein JWP01_4058 [Myxococcales bacterium]|nr:hypothetical protein [Myxococcales bacterium]
MRADEIAASYQRLAAAIGADARDVDVVRELAIRCGWGARSTAAPLLPSGMSHGVPWGLSIAAGQPELRVFVEAQADPAGPTSYWDAAHDVVAFTAEQGAYVDHLRAMTRDLHATAAMPLRMWHAVAFDPRRPERAARWHAYVCIPPARPELAALLLERCGVEMPVLRPQDRITIVSVDLVVQGRIKAYVLMPDAPLDAVAALHDRAEAAVPGDVAQFGTAMLGDVRPIWWLACLGFATGARAPATCALHFGVPRHVDEPTARSRIRALLDRCGLDAHAWQRAADALGAHHFVSFQRLAGAPRVTTYFLPEVVR